MILLLLCMWNRSCTQTLVCVFVWPLLHRFFMLCLSHISITAHVSGCCQKPGSHVIKPCKTQMRDSVRTLLTFTHSTIVPLWSGFLLASRQYDVESNSVLQVQSMSFHLYSLYWNVRDFTGKRSPNHEHRNIRYSKRTVGLFILHNLLSASTLFCNLRIVSLEMNGWRSSVIDLFDLSMSWDSTTSTQRRVLSQHLLAKKSAISWAATVQLLVHETPNMFFHLLALMRMSPKRPVGFEQNTWTARLENFETNSERAASLGAAAWLRERGGATGPATPGTLQSWATERNIRGAHYLSFAGIRIIGGLLAMRNILSLEPVVSDTVYVTAVLLHYALALYFFAGIMAYSTKRMTGPSERNMPLRLVTSCSDDWLQ